MSNIGDESSDVSEYEDVLMFKCKKCGKDCIEAEKDSHRAMHNEQERERAPSLIQSASLTVSQEDVTAAPRKNPSRLAKRKAAAALETPKPERKPRKARAKPRKMSRLKTRPDPQADFNHYQSRTRLGPKPIKYKDRVDKGPIGLDMFRC